MSRTKRILTQDDIRASGHCGYGYRPSDGKHCGRPSETGAPFGYCPQHARELYEMAQEIGRRDPAYQSDARLERGNRVDEAEHWENVGLRRSDWAERLVREDAVRQRGRAATERSRGRSR